MPLPLRYVLAGLPGIAACVLGLVGLYLGLRVFLQESRLGRGPQASPLVRTAFLRSIGIFLVGTQWLLFAYYGVDIVFGPFWLWPLVIGIVLMVTGSIYWRLSQRAHRGSDQRG